MRSRKQENRVEISDFVPDFNFDWSIFRKENIRLTTDRWKPKVPLSISIKELAKLSNVSSLEKTYHILHEDDRELSCILKNCLTAPTAPKDASESE